MNGKKKAQAAANKSGGYLYDIIVFTGLEDKVTLNKNNCLTINVDKDTKKATDVVPEFWVTYSKSLGSLVTPFLPPPYDKSNTRELHKLVKSRSEPLDIWPEYAVELRGGANTYAEALKKVKLLEEKNFVYTTDVDQLPEEKAQEESQRKKMKPAKIKVNLDKQDRLLNSAPALRKAKNEIYGESSQNTNFETIRLTSKRKWTSSVNLSDENDEIRTNHLRRKISESSYDITLSPSNKSDSSENSKISEKSNDHSVIPKFDVDNYYSQSDPTNRPESLKINRRTSEENLEPDFETIPLLENSNIKSSDSLRSTEKSADKKRIPISTYTSLPPKSTKNRIIDMEKSVYNPNVSEEEEANPVLLFKRILKGLYFLSVEQKELKKAVTQLCTAKPINEREIGSLTETLAETYDMDLPVKDLKSFNTLDSTIFTDKAFRKKFKNSLSGLIDKDNLLPRTIRNIIQKYISRDVILQFTAQKKSGTKELIFKDTEFYKAMKDVLFAKYNSATTIGLTEFTLLKQLGNVISNAVDWDGYRALRGNKKQVDSGK